MRLLILPTHLSGGFATTKDSFHKDGRSFLKRLQNVLGVPGRVSSNKAGEAVYGDVRLKAEAFEVVLLTDSVRGTWADIKVLYRKRLSSGNIEGTGLNQWTTLKEIEADPEAFLAKIKAL